MNNSVFEEAKKKRLAKQAEAEAKKNSAGFNYSSDPIQYMGLETGKEKVFRIVGAPYESREKGSDVKIILYSEILNDAGTGYVKVTWPLIEKGDKFLPDPEWFFTKFYNALNEGKWEKFTEDMVNNETVFKKDGKLVSKWGKEVYWSNFHKNKVCYKKILKENNRTAKEKFAREVFPKSRVLMNVIDRHDNWCAENNHTKVLSSKAQPYSFKNDKGEEQTITYVDRGVPISIYSTIWETVISPRGHWDLDIIIKKLKKTETQTANYSIRDAKEDKISEESKKIASIKPLTAEELKYEAYDLDDIFKPTSFYKLDKEFKNWFKQADLELGTKFYAELQDLAMEEMKARQTNEKDNQKVYSISDVVNENETVEADVEESKEEPKQERKGRVQTTSNVSLETLSYWKNLDIDDQEDIKKVFKEFSADGKTMLFNDSAVTVPCDKCKKMLPDTVMHCPYCDAKF